MKRFFTVVCSAVAAALLCLGLAACGQNGDMGDPHLLFEKDGKSYTVTGLRGECAEEEIVIPASHEGLPVTAIGKEAFKGNQTMKRVSLPASLELIGEGAFSGCTSLESIGIPNGVKTVGRFAFSDCDSLKSAEIAGSVKEFGEGVFAYDGALETVDLKEGIEALGDFCFLGCSALKTVRLPEGLQAIGLDTFESCTSLEAIAFPESLREIDAYAFCNSGLKEVVIPDNVTRVGTMAFQCPSITRVDLGNGIKSIGSHAFSYISAEEIVVPDSVTDVGICAFGFNDVLKKVTIGKRCTGITYGMFCMCPSLETVTISTVCAVCDSAFGGCENLRDVYFCLDEEQWALCTVGAESDENPLNGYGNTYFSRANLYFYSEERNADGQHWHYGEDGAPVLWE